MINYLNFKGLIPCAIAACSVIYSCTDNDSSFNDGQTENLLDERGSSSKQIIDENLSSFARILSKVVANNRDVRVFLKEKSLEEFDKNTDVLYYLVSDELIGDKTFRELLVEASSEEEISKIERNVPLLNIYNVRVDALNVFPENLDVEDNEIPVAVSMPDSTYLYFDGAKDCGLAKGEVPGFNLFVVGLNTRVDAKSISIANNDNYRTKDGLKRATAKTVMFKSPNYDGRESNILKKSANMPYKMIDTKIQGAYYYFYADNNSSRQIAFQRDFIYYGISPLQMQGRLNGAVSEYLAYIEINPRTYFTIIDDKSGKETGDAYIKQFDYSQQKHPLTEEEKIEKFWSTGGYNLKFDIIKSTQSVATSVYVPVRPEDIWDFHIEYTETPATRWKHSKHTYKINPREFSSKPYYLYNMVDLGKWDISKEALYRTIIISEVDEEKEISSTYTYDVRKAKSWNFSGNQKMNIGLSIGKVITAANLEQSVTASANNTTTTTETISVTITAKEGSDPLGSVDIYYYDPIVTGRNGNDYIIKTYNTGSVTFGVLAK